MNAIQQYVDYFQNRLTQPPAIASGYVYALLYHPHAGARKVTECIPLVFVFDVDERLRWLRGVNLYRLPYHARDIMAAKLRLLTKDRKENEQPRRLPDVSAERMNAFTKLAETAMRTYTMSKIVNMKVVPFSHLDEVLEIYNKIPIEG